MKNYIFLFCLTFSWPLLGMTKTNALAGFQELCAKESDPLKRHNYCLLWEKNSEQSLIDNFHKNTVIA